MKTEKQLKSFRIELQKTQEQQEQRRIQQETAKVFLGTVIQRGETNTRLLKIVRLTLNNNKDFKKMGFLVIGVSFEISMSLKMIGIAILIFSFSQSALLFDFINKINI